VTFAKADEGISAFVVDAKEVDASERIHIVAPHPMATVKYKGARGELLGEAGQGFKLAMRNLDIFRTTVAAAALGFARRALDAVQICGGLGVMRGHPVERLYREVRALRIYEGATEVQKLIIARELLKQ